MAIPYVMIMAVVMPFFIHGMDQPTKMNPSIIDIIETVYTRDVAFIGNEAVIVRPRRQKSFIYELKTKNKVDFLANDVDFSQACIVTDHAKKRALISYGPERLNTLIVYDSTIQKTFTYPDVSRDLRICNNSFDERKPHSIFVLQKDPRDGSVARMVSYDYINQQTEVEQSLSQEVQDYKSLGYRHVLNALTGACTIFTENKDFFEMYMEFLPCGRQILRYSKAISGDVERNFVYSSDMSFIAYYCADNSCRHDYLSSPLGDTGFLCRVCDACYILNLRTGKSVRCHNFVDSVIPYSMAFHPNNKYIVTLSVLNGWVEYWQADNGKLIAQEHVPEIYAKKGSTDNPRAFKKYLSFSADGEFLVAAFIRNCVILKVPFEVVWGISQDRAIAILWCLRNIAPALAQDVQNVIVNKLKQ